MKVSLHRLDRRLGHLAVYIIGFIVVAGCASATGIPTQRASLELQCWSMILL